MEKLTRVEAVALVGEAMVATVEAGHCEPTSRWYDHPDGEIEWRADVRLPNGDYLAAWYYTNAKDAETAEAYGDWGAVDWTVAYYTIGG